MKTELVPCRVFCICADTCSGSHSCSYYSACAFLANKAWCPAPCVPWTGAKNIFLILDHGKVSYRRARDASGLKIFTRQAAKFPTLSRNGKGRVQDVQHSFVLEQAKEKQIT
jgi:hypothetical protein